MDDTCIRGTTIVKITLNVNLVPCTRDGYVKGNPYSDLTLNVLQARKLIRLANQFFFLKDGAGVFSGFIDEFAAGTFTLKLWQDGVVRRTIVVRDLGYAGVLHAEVPVEAVGFDSLSAAAWSDAEPLVALAA